MAASRVRCKAILCAAKDCPWAIHRFAGIRSDFHGKHGVNFLKLFQDGKNSLQTEVSMILLQMITRAWSETEDKNGEISGYC